LPSPNGAEKKHFLSSESDAKALKGKFDERLGKEHTVVEAKGPKDVVDKAETYEFHDVPGGQTATAVPNEELPKFFVVCTGKLDC
jgi:hypothetical protein